MTGEVGDPGGDRDVSAVALGEFRLIGRLEHWLDRAGGAVLLGTGDDAAVVRAGPEVAVAVDALVEDRHFLRSFSSLADVGWKAVAVNVSDLAAIGAAPVAAVVALLRPDHVTTEDLEDLYRGMRAAADRWGCGLVGGDTVGADTLSVSVTVLGALDGGRYVTRSGARPGERIIVVGSLGAAAAGLGLHRAGLEVPGPLARAHTRPEALPAAGRVLAAAGATAMIDVSDGLGADLRHICVASRVGAEVVRSALPVATGVVAAAGRLELDPWDLVVGGGDDYALVATVPGDRVDAAIEALRAEPGVEAGTPVSVVGRTLAGVDGDHEPVLVDGDARIRIGSRGFDHYAGSGNGSDA